MIPRDTLVEAGFLALFLFLSAASAFGGEFGVEGGLYPAARLQVAKPSMALLSYDMLMYSQFDVKIDVFPWLYAAGATTIFFYPYSQAIMFYPLYALFMVGAGVQFGPLTIGYEHRCDHPVVPYSFVADPLVSQDSGYDKVFFRYAVSF